MDNELHGTIAALHSSGRQIVIATTGGGAMAVSWLTCVPGATALLLEARMPYSNNALNEWLAQSPAAACNELTARHMAMAAWQRAAHLVGGPRRGLIGIGTTASLVTNRPKRGTHRVHAAWQSDAASGLLSIELIKGARDRMSEEEIASRITLAALAEAADLTPPFVQLQPNETIARQVQFAQPEWTELLVGERPFLVHGADEPPKVLVAGSFHPLHAGHRAMQAWSTRHTKQPVGFELSMTNVDKPPLDFIELSERIRQFEDLPVVVTAAPTFVKKARALPGTTFAIGADTALRIADPRYYPECETGLQDAMRELRELNTKFLVFGREQGGKFIELAQLDLPREFRDLCQGVPEAEFREDLSSSELRDGA